MLKTPITLEVLTIIDTVARRQSFAKAAEELNKAPSAISYAIQKLEDQLDVSIYERQGRRSVLTPAGELLLEHGRELLQSANNLALQAKQVSTGWEPKLRVAVESIYSFPFVLEKIAAFLKQHPDVEFDIVQSVLNGGWEAVINNNVDVLIGSTIQGPHHNGLRVKPLNKIDLKLVISASHQHIARIKKGSHNTLTGLRRIITHDTSQNYIAKSAGLIDGKKHFYVQTIEQKVNAILAGIGIGHLPTHIADELIKKGMLLELSDKKQTHQTFMAWKIKNKGLALKEFVTLLSAFD